MMPFPALARHASMVSRPRPLANLLARDGPSKTHQVCLKQRELPDAPSSTTRLPTLPGSRSGRWESRPVSGCAASRSPGGRRLLVFLSISLFE